MTDTPTSGAQSLEAGLARCQDTVAKSLDLAESIDRRRDDAAQDDAYRRALAFLKMSAKLGMALAKLKGEHTSNIRIHRTEIAEQPLIVEFPPPPRKDPPPKTKPPEPIDPQVQARINKIYNGWLRSRAENEGDITPVFADEGEENDAG
jgi:hypothetical protein